MAGVRSFGAGVADVDGDWDTVEEPYEYTMTEVGTVRPVRPYALYAPYAPYAPFAPYT